MPVSNAPDFSDNAMLDLFRAEVETHTQTLNEGLLALEKEPNQLKRIEPLMRAAHSIKGAARIVGVEDGVRVAHVMEDCLVAAQNGQIALTSEAIDILLRGVDALTRIAGPDQSPPASADLDQLILEISFVRQGKPRSAKKPAPPPEPAGVAAPSSPAIAVVLDGPSRTVGVPAHLDGPAAELLRQTLLEQLDTGGRQFRLDLGAVRSIDGAGLALLSLFAQTLARSVSEGTNNPSLTLRASINGLQIRPAETARPELVNVGPDLATLFRATGLDSLYQLKQAGS